jgi:hypothetical protein
MGKQRFAAGTAARPQLSATTTEAHVQNAAMGTAVGNSAAALARVAVVASVRAQSAARMVGAARRSLCRRAGARPGPVHENAVPVRGSDLHRVDPYEGYPASSRADCLGAPLARDPAPV